MTIEDTFEPLELRMHHVDRLFYAWQDTPMEEREALVVSKGYSPEFADNLMEYNSLFFEHNTPFTIVPALDGLCKKCRGKIRETKCELQDPDFEVRGVAAIFGKDVVVGGTYTPLDLTERALSYVRKNIEETGKLPEEYQDNELLATYKKRLAGLEAAYERLLQVAGEAR